MQILLKQGVDGINFGMTEDAIATLLGMPDKVVVTEFGNRDLCYFAPKLVLKIEPGNGSRLGWISVRNKSARLAGIDPWSTSVGSVLAHLSSLLGEQYELEDYGELESYNFKDSWVELQYELGELTAINFGVPYDINDEPVWPATL